MDFFKQTLENISKMELPEDMSDAQIRELAEKEFQSAYDKLDEYNYHAITISGLRGFVLAKNWPKDDIICVDVLACLRSCIESQEKLGEIWMEANPGKLEAFMAKVEKHNVEYNKQLCDDIDKVEKQLHELLCGGEDMGNVTSRSRTGTGNSRPRKMTLEEKFEFIGDAVREKKIDDLILAIDKKIYRDKVTRLVHRIEKYFENHFQGAKVYMESKNSTIECLEARLEYLQECIRNKTLPTSYENKENFQIPEVEMSDEEYERLVVKNSELEGEIEHLKRREEIIKTLDPKLVQEYLQLHRQHEYLSNLASGNTSVPNKESSLALSESNNSLSDRFSSTPFNSLLSRSSLNCMSLDASAISLSYDTTPHYDESTM